MTDKDRLLLALIEDFLPFLREARDPLLLIDRLKSQQLFTLLELIHEITLIESGKARSAHDLVPVASFLKLVSASLEFTAGQYNVNLSVDPSPTIQDFQGDQKRLKTAVLTLLGAVFQNLPPQSSAKLFLSSNQDEDLLLNAALKNLKGSDFDLQRVKTQGDFTAALILLHLVGGRFDSIALESEEILISITLFTSSKGKNVKPQEEFVRFDLPLPSSNVSAQSADNIISQTPDEHHQELQEEEKSDTTEVRTKDAAPLEPPSEATSEVSKELNSADSQIDQNDLSVKDSRLDWVLVADDSPLSLKNISRILTDAGYNVETATNGKEALQKAFEREYRFVIIDIKMPLINGLKAASLIRDKEKLSGRRLPIIGLCVHLSPEEEKEAYGSMDLVLRKPLLEEELTAAIARLLLRVS